MSLLTQFYNCSSSGGGGGGGANTSGYATIIFGRTGSTTFNFTAANWTGGRDFGVLIPNPTGTGAGPNVAEGFLQTVGTTFTEIYINNTQFTVDSAGSGGIQIVGNTDLTTIYWNNSTVGPGLNIAGTNYFSGFNVGSCTSLTSIEGSGFISGTINLSNNSSLSTISSDIVFAPRATTSNTFSFDGNAFSADTLNSMLVNMAKFASGNGACIISFTGGTNAGSAALTPAGTAAIATLLTRGFSSVNLN